MGFPTDDREATLTAQKALQDGLKSLLHKNGRFQVVERADPKIIDPIRPILTPGRHLQDSW
jgi:hypothetical protein